MSYVTFADIKVSWFPTGSYHTAKGWGHGRVREPCVALPDWSAAAATEIYLLRHFSLGRTVLVIQSRREEILSRHRKPVLIYKFISNVSIV